MTPFIYVLGLTLLATHIAANRYANARNCEELCCDGVSYERNRTTRCCGKEVYDNTLYGCCEDEIVELPNKYDVNYGCCKNEEGTVASYSENSHICCGGEVIAKPDCAKYYECCGGKLFDYFEEICCDDQISEKNKGKTTVCVGNQIAELEDGTEVCGDEIITSTDHMCCQTWSYDQDTKQSTSTGKAHEKTGDLDQGCCGVEIYNYKTQICCYNPSDDGGNYALEKPEGSSEFAYHQCCGDVVITNYTAEGCCFDTVYNPNEEQCCGKKVYAISEVEKDKTCCWYTSEFYDYTTQTCKKDGVIDDSQETVENNEETDENEEENASCVPSLEDDQYQCMTQCEVDIQTTF